MAEIITMLGNPLTVLTLLPITGSLLLMLVHWMGNDERREMLSNPIRYTNLGLALLMFALATLIGLEEKWLGMGGISLPKLRSWRRQYRFLHSD